MQIQFGDKYISRFLYRGPRVVREDRPFLAGHTYPPHYAALEPEAQERARDALLKRLNEVLLLECKGAGLPVAFSKAKWAQWLGQFVTDGARDNTKTRQEQEFETLKADIATWEWTPPVVQQRNHRLLEKRTEWLQNFLKAFPKAGETAKKLRALQEIQEMMQEMGPWILLQPKTVQAMRGLDIREAMTQDELVESEAAERMMVEPPEERWMLPETVLEVPYRITRKGATPGEDVIELLNVPKVIDKLKADAPDAPSVFHYAIG